MPLITVTTPTAHEAVDINIDAIAYTISPNVQITVYVPVEHLSALTTAIQTQIPSAVITTRPE